MKLVLASQGFTTDEIAENVSELVGKSLSSINISIINEAYVVLPEEKDKRWLIQELGNIAKYIGGTIDFVNLRAYTKEEIRKRLVNTDIIYIVGGKQFILPKLFKETGFDEILRECAKNKIIMGTSAGATVLGKQIESAPYWKERYQVEKEKIENKTLGLVEFNIVPHYMREDHKKWNKEFLEEVLRDNPFPVYAIRDDQAIIYDEGKLKFVGGNPEIFGKNI